MLLSVIEDPGMPLLKEFLLAVPRVVVLPIFMLNGVLIPKSFPPQVLNAIINLATANNSWMICGFCGMVLLVYFLCF